MSDDNRSLSDGVRNWVVAIATICGIFGGIVYWQIVSNQTTIATAERVQQIQQDIEKIRTSLDGMPQMVRQLEVQFRDQQNSNAVQNSQLNALITSTAETKLRLDNLERASNTKLR